MPSRRPTHTHVEVPLRRSLGGEGAPLRGILVENLTKYLLFVRQQLPKQFDEVRAELAPAGAPARPAGSTMASRRRLRCIEAAESAFAAVRELCDGAEAPDMAAIIIGHSPTLPKEAYVLRFAAEPEPSDPEAELDAAGVQDSTRRLLRKLVAEVESQFEGVRRPMRTWIFLHHPSSAALEGSRPLFSPRPSFRVALNSSCQVVTIDVGMQEGFSPDAAKWHGVVTRAGRAGPPRAHDFGSSFGRWEASVEPAGRAEGREQRLPAAEGGNRAERAGDAELELSDMVLCDEARIDAGDDDALAQLRTGESAAFDDASLTCGQEGAGIWSQCEHVIAGYQPSR